MPLYRLIYKSTSTQPLTSDFLKSLEGISKKNNSALGVTGILISNKTSFMQVLEGESKSVNTIYRNLCKDPRHSDIELICYDKITHREFSDWSMKCLSTGIMGRLIADQLKKKFGTDNSDLILPTDGDKAFALLFDLAFLLKTGEI